MDQLNPCRESYTIDKKMALLMHGIFDCGPFHMCVKAPITITNFLFQFQVAQRFARAPSESIRPKFIKVRLKLR